MLIAEALEAVDQVQRETVGRAGCDADQVCEACFFERLHPVPDRLARVAGAVRVVQQQQVELVDAAALEAALGRHLQVARVLLRSAQTRVREARKALSAVAFAVIEVVADGADDADLITRKRRVSERASEPDVGFTGAVSVSGQHRPDLFVGSDQSLEACVVERLAEVHEAAAAPGADRGACGVGAHRTVMLIGTAPPARYRHRAVE